GQGDSRARPRPPAQGPSQRAPCPARTPAALKPFSRGTDSLSLSSKRASPFPPEPGPLHMSAPAETEEPERASFLEGLLVYLRPGVLIVALLGFSSGLPLALSGETLRVWMADRGVDLGTIGLLSLAGLPYTLKFIWAPVVDAWQVPYLSRLGRRPGWLVATQLLLIPTLLFLGS